MEVIIQKSKQAACSLLADLLCHALAANPRLVLGLATGRTMEAVYALLVERYRAGRCSFSQASTFNLDEYIGLPENSPHSYVHYMNEHLFRHIDIAMEHVHIPNGRADDVDAECLAYEEKIRASGGIDLQILGLGKVGHIGFNEPLSALLSRTRAKSLAPVTRQQNASLFASLEAVPIRAITMGVGTILDSKRCLMLVTGKDKAAILAQAVEGPVSSSISASALQLHPRCTVIVDEDAASELKNREYYEWIFENEPEWEEFRNREALKKYLVWMRSDFG